MNRASIESSQQRKKARLNTPTGSGQAPNTEAEALRAQRNKKGRQGVP